MKGIGLCGRCTKRDGCRFRLPGTWVEECGQFEADPARPALPPEAESVPRQPGAPLAPPAVGNAPAAAP
jgi:hypothetical protein